MHYLLSLVLIEELSDAYKNTPKLFELKSFVFGIRFSLHPLASSELHCAKFHNCGTYPLAVLN
jgi:hypothetical protein